MQQNLRKVLFLRKRMSFFIKVVNTSGISTLEFCIISTVICLTTVFTVIQTTGEIEASARKHDED